MSAFVIIIGVLYPNAKISSTNLQGHFGYLYEAGYSPQSDSASVSDCECFGTNQNTPGKLPHLARIFDSKHAGRRCKKEKKEEDVWEEKRQVEGYL